MVEEDLVMMMQWFMSQELSGRLSDSVSRRVNATDMNWAGFCNGLVYIIKLGLLSIWYQAKSIQQTQ